jgi:hypothetical protein
MTGSVSSLSLEKHRIIRHPDAVVVTGGLTQGVAAGDIMPLADVLIGFVLLAFVILAMTPDAFLLTANEKV